ncbi:MAG TPA: twin-arginine translocase TatA/TatE family subunit [Myxococcales bacterium]|jgi:sec-independent protein translocase protein TatA|nr:twin-arginine translocase TatA/TatE family subunit [Myxococcales bacterium]
MNLGFGELLLIFLVIILVFGSSKLPALGDALGRGIKNFKRTFNEPESIDVTPGKTEPAPGVKVPPPAPAETVAKK